MILAGEETLCVDGFLLQTSGLLGTVAQAFNPSTGLSPKTLVQFLPHLNGSSLPS